MPRSSNKPGPLKPKGPVRVRQVLGKYRIERRMGEGGFATVYQARDSIEGVRVALKIPHPYLVNSELLDDFRHEVRMAAQLDHPNILPLKSADVIDGHFVVAYPLGERTLGARLQKRISLALAIEFAEQMLDAVAYAHDLKIIHCDIKPDNLIVFPGNHLMLADFGLAKVAQRTIHASGSGTIGYCAPEQAMGKPSFRSDVFALGLILYRMLSGQLPEYPFAWPPPGYDRLRRHAHRDLVEMVRRAIEVDPRKRFPHAGAMLAALRRVKGRTLRYQGSSPRRLASQRSQRDWRSVRHKQFQRLFGNQLETIYECSRCEGPVAESMIACPWCGADRSEHKGSTRFPIHCPRCNRGLKLDWHYCPWCFGGGFEVESTREYSDRRYTARCTNAKCSRKVLMPFMRYCPWCRQKVKRKWKLDGTSDKCPSCKWAVVSEFWTTCPWCGKTLAKT